MRNPLVDTSKNKPTEQQKVFIDAMLGEARGDPRTAAAIANYKPSYAYEVVEKVKDELIEGAKRILALYGIKAAYSLTEALNDDDITPQTKIKLRAAEQILDRIGVHKNEQAGVSLNDSNAIILFPAKNDA